VWEKRGVRAELAWESLTKANNDAGGGDAQKTDVHATILRHVRTQMEENRGRIVSTYEPDADDSSSAVHVDKVDGSKRRSKRGGTRRHRRKNAGNKHNEDDDEDMRSLNGDSESEILGRSYDRDEYDRRGERGFWDDIDGGSY
jgi:hypothetical protein